jgi:phosphoglycolate phosphatase-like HAD superfamily hydrolase
MRIRLNFGRHATVGRWLVLSLLVPVTFLSFLTTFSHGFSTTTTTNKNNNNIKIPTIPTVLITLDVDGTLVKGSGTAAKHGAHSQAFTYAIQTALREEGQPSPVVANVADTLPQQLYHGSTDGLILLRYAQAALKVPPSQAGRQLDTMMQLMYDYIMTLDDDQVSNFLTPLPGVMETMERLAALQQQQQQQQQEQPSPSPQSHVVCGLVTGNVEGIARRKMKAVGILQTGALHPPCETQPQWSGTQDIGFLGGFGSDYCSKDIDNLDRNFLDRGEQIKIAARRCETILQKKNQADNDPTSTTCGTRYLKRVVHVGDAPADVLAAKSLAESRPEYCVGMVAVATGSYKAEELKELCGTPIPGQWEPVVLEEGMKDPTAFLKACGIEYY